MCLSENYETCTTFIISQDVPSIKVSCTTEMFGLSPFIPCLQVIIPLYTVISDPIS